MKRNQIAVKLCIGLLKRQGKYDVVNEVHINELSPPMFVFKVVEEMKRGNMCGLAELVVSYIGTGEEQTDDYSDDDDDDKYGDSVSDDDEL